jgi:uncharacterized protein (DUF433 family)
VNAIAARLGIFSVADAERLTSVPRRQIRGWLQGYAQRAGVKAAPPVLKRQHEPIDGELALGFLDLIEVAFLGTIVHAARLRGHTPSWHAIRAAAETARRILDSDHPFAARRIHTDGRNIFLEAQRETGDAGLYDLTRDNFAILDVLSQSFVASVEYEADEPRAWTPDERFPRIVVDPRRAFGRPVERESGAPAEALFDAWRAEGQDAVRVARAYGTDSDGVNQAVRFVVGTGPRLAA